jgi:hypothetical protein
MGGKSARTKGHSFERFIARLFQFVGYTGAQRQLEYQINQAQGIDLANTGRYKIQCKKTKKYVPLSTINEIKYKDGDVPVLIAAGDAEPPLAVMRLEDFLELVSADAFNMDVTSVSSADVIKEIKRIRGGTK